MTTLNREMTLTHESIEKFRISLEERGLATLTLKAYCSDLKIFLSDLNLESIPHEELGPNAARWLNQTRKQASPKTTARRLTSIRAYAESHGLNVLAQYKLPVAAKSLPHPLPGGMQDVERLIDAAHCWHHKALIALMGYCGLRVSEALSVEKDSIDLRNVILLVRGKGDKDRRIPISSKALAVLFPILMGRSNYISHKLVPISDSAARAYLTRLGEQVLGMPVATHDLRMTFGTAVNDQYGLRVAQELLGHASSKTTEGYTLVTLDQMRKAVEL